MLTEAKIHENDLQFEVDLAGNYAFKMGEFSWSDRSGAKTHSLKDVNFVIPRGSCTTVVGASGSGKTTLLNIMAKKLRPNRTLDPSPEQSVVLHNQNARLMPWLTIRENLMLEKPFAENEIFSKVCNQLELTSILGRFPHQVSGGQRERTALGRSLLRQPDILLLDEPLAGTDHFLRLQVENFLSDIVDQTGRTIVVVTHDLTEAIAISDRIIFLSGGDGVFTTGVIDIPDSVRTAPPSKVRQLPDFPGLMAELTKALGGS